MSIAMSKVDDLQAAKRRALRIADERSKENVELRAKIERLRVAFGNAACPRPANQAPDHLTISECRKRGECGCDLGQAYEQKAD